MSGADLWEDGYPHGTPEGYRGGCRGSACPANVEIGMSCRQADIWAHGNYTYRRLAAQGATPAEIAAAIHAGDTPPTPPRPETPMTLTALSAPTVDPVDDTDPELDPPATDAALAEPDDAGDVLEADEASSVDDEPTVAPVDEGVDEAPAPVAEADPEPDRWETFPNPARHASDGLAPEARRTIRAWAQRNNIDVSSRGLLGHGVIAAFERAHGKDLPAVTHHQSAAAPAPATEPATPAVDEPAPTPVEDSADAVRDAAHRAIRRNTDIRKWARKSGWEVPDRGRIQDAIVRAYDTAHATPTADPPTPAPAPEAAQPLAESFPDRMLADTSESTADEPPEGGTLLDGAGIREGMGHPQTAGEFGWPDPAAAARFVDAINETSHRLHIAATTGVWPHSVMPTFPETVDAGGRPDHELIRELEDKLAAAEMLRDTALADRDAAHAAMILALRKWADGQDVIARLERIIASQKRTIHRIDAADYALAAFRRVDASDERRAARRRLFGIIGPRR